MMILESTYKIGKTIGEGGYGVVKEGYRVVDGAPVAIKIVRKGKTLFTGRYDKVIIVINKKAGFVCEIHFIFQIFVL